MFYNAKPHIFEKAKLLRENMTLAELRLWNALKGKQVLNLKFRPQHPIDIFIADFYCHQVKLVIEIDGEIHQDEEQLEYDIGREAELSYLGIKVIRFTNKEIFNNLPEVVAKIESVSSKLLATQKSPL
jgi:very-short-patch-repair endonuclease